MMHRVGTAVVGCGNIASFYFSTLPQHPILNVIGVVDRDENRSTRYAQYYSVKKYPSFDAVLSDQRVELVINLTSPRSHHAISKACLEAGKHVYSEKPLALSFLEAGQLVRLAEQKGLLIASAPSRILAETAQTMWKAVRDGAIGQVRLVYANFDDGMLAPNMSPWLWKNSRGVVWPAKDEFEIGCTYEHAGYVLTWLAAFFGPATSVTSFASCQLQQKGIAVEMMAPDFTVGCIEYPGNVVARVTCGLVAPRDKSLTIVGDEGVLFTGNVRNEASPVYLRRIPSAGWRAAIEGRLNRLRTKLEWRMKNVLWSGHDWFFQQKVPFARRPQKRFAVPGKQVDFCRGPAELSDAIAERRPCRLSANLGVHIVELIEGLQHPERFGGCRQIASTFDPIEPLPWTK
jgi:predicted dehydrogenase